MTTAPRGLLGQGDGLREGAKVRVSTALVKEATGVVRSLGPDSLVIFTEPYGAPLRLSQSELTRLEVSQGRRAAEGAKKGAMWGAIAGLTVGAIALISPPAKNSRATANENGPSDAAFVGANIVGMVVTGAGIGALIKAERWTGAEVRARVTVGRTMVRTGLSVPFPRRF